MAKLAINGGNKLVNVDRKHFEWPEVTDKIRNAVLNQLDVNISIYDRSGIIAELEQRFADYHSRRHSLLTSSGTAALHSIYVGAGFGPGDEIICPAYTFFATITPLFFTGAIPVLVDCRNDGNIDPSKIAAKITPRTKAIIVTHMWGLPCDMEPIIEVADKYKLLLIEDASHAHGASYRGKKVGDFGFASAFSLQGQKTVTGGEGGIILTDDDELFYRSLLLGHYNKRCKTEIPKDHTLYPFAGTGMGLKLRIHPIAARIANEQFKTLDDVLNGRRRIAKKLIANLKGLKGIRLPKAPDYCDHTWYAFVMQYKGEELNDLPIEKFYQALRAEGCIELDRPSSICPVNLYPLFQSPGRIFPNYENTLQYKQGDFTVAENFHENALKLPVWHKASDEALVNLYISAFEKVIEHHKELL